MKRKSKKKKTKIVIKKEDIKPSHGHSLHDNGCGVHDNRPKRIRTRSAQQQRALQDYHVR